MMKNIWFAICFLLLGSLAQAQELGLYFMDNVYQSTYLNPGRFMKNRVNVGLPGFMVLATHDGPTIGDMLTTNSAGEDVIDLNRGISQLNDNNLLHAGIQVETFNVAFRIKKWQFGISHSIRNRATFGYSRDFATVMVEGNGDYVDETADMGINMDLTAYGELGFHAAYKVIPGLTVGARFKWLSGIGNLSSGNDRIDLYTDPEYYQLTATTDYEIRSGGTYWNLNLNTDNTDDAEFDLEANLDSISAGEFFFGPNNGFGLDLGAEFKLLDKLTLSASILDMGSITWEDNVSRYRSQGTYTFEGADAQDGLFDEDADFEASVDTLLNNLGFEETNPGSYTQALGGRYMLGGSYAIKKGLIGGLLLYGDNFGEQFNPSFALSLQKRFGRIFSLGLLYSAHPGDADNIGANFALNLGPVQLYGSTDYLTSLLRPLDINRVHARFGLNVAVGKMD